MRIWTAITHKWVGQQPGRWGVRALAVLLLLGLMPQGFAAPPTRLNFDHLTTGFELIGQHREGACTPAMALPLDRLTRYVCRDTHAAP